MHDGEFRFHVSPGSQEGQVGGVAREATNSQGSWVIDGQVAGRNHHALKEALGHFPAVLGQKPKRLCELYQDVEQQQQSYGSERMPSLLKMAEECVKSLRLRLGLT
jgi:hypothetical protein